MSKTRAFLTDRFGDFDPAIFFTVDRARARGRPDDDRLADADILEMDWVDSSPAISTGDIGSMGGTLVDPERVERRLAIH